MLQDKHRVAILAADRDAVLGDYPDLIAALTSMGAATRCILTNDIAPVGRASGDRALEAQGASLLRLETASGALSLIQGAAATHRLTGLLRAEKPDTVLICGRRLPLAAAVAARMARSGNVVLLLPCLGARLLSARKERDWVRAQGALRKLQAALNCCHAVILRNEADRRTVIDAGILPSEMRVRVVAGPGVDCEQVARLDLPAVSGRVRFVMAATNLTHAAIAEFSTAAKKIRTQMAHPAAGAMDFAIWHPASERSEAVTALLTASPVIRLASSMPAADAIGWGHVQVVVDHGQGVPCELTLALALGRALIVSASPGCRDTVDERVNGIMVQPGDSGRLAEAMTAIAGRPDLLPAMARASRQKAERLYRLPPLRRALIEALKLVAVAGQRV